MKRKRWKWKWVMLGMTLALFSIVGYYAYSIYSFADTIHKNPKDSIFAQFYQTEKTSTQKGGEDLTPPKWEGKERVNILILGGDSRGLRKNEVPRSDSNMVLSIDPQTKKSYLFSILRDTYVKIPNHGMDRINTAISTGGPDLAMKTVSDLLGIPIQYYVYTDFQGFIKVVDAVGGIDIDVEKDMKYVDAADNHEFDIDLKKGYQHLDGKHALQYVRFRHDATSDFTRTERQRKFMKALADKMQSTSSILKLPKILSAMDPYIETNLSVTEMLKLGTLGFDVKTSGMVSEQIPPQDLLEEKRVGGAEVLTVNTTKLHTFIRGLMGITGSDPTDTGKGTLSQKDSDESSAGKSSSKASNGTAGGTKSSTASSSGKTGTAGGTVKSEAAGKTATSTKSGSGTGSKSGTETSTGTGTKTTESGTKSGGTGTKSSGTTDQAAGTKSSGTGSGTKDDPSTSAGGNGGSGSGSSADLLEPVKDIVQGSKSDSASQPQVEESVD